FKEAKGSIRITSFYFKPAPSILNAILEAAKKGVKVEIYHSHRDALGPSILPWIPSFLMYPKLLAAGVRIYESRQGEHTKLIVIDDALALFGSYNLEYAAHDRMAEVMLASDNGEMVRRISAFLDSLPGNGDYAAVTSASAEDLPGNIRFK